MGHNTPCFKFTLLKALLISTKPALHCILPQRKLVRSIHKHQIQLGAFGGWWFPQNIENTQTKPHQLFLAVKYSNMCVLDFHRRAQTSSNQNRTDMRTSVPKWARSQVSELRKRVSHSSSACLHHIQEMFYWMAPVKHASRLVKAVTSVFSTVDCKVEVIFETGQRTKIKEKKMLLFLQLCIKPLFTADGQDCCFACTTERKSGVSNSSPGELLSCTF